MSVPLSVPIALTVNGKAVNVSVDPRTLLVQLIRENLQLTGTHVGCDTAQCGACTVHLNGRAVKSCSMLAAQAQGATRGFRWGDVREWTAGTLRPYPGSTGSAGSPDSPDSPGIGVASPGQAADAPASGEVLPRVQRGASFATRDRKSVV